MDVKNWRLKRKQLKSMKLNDDLNYYLSLPFDCPKCYWATDNITDYVNHLENHLGKQNKKKIGELT